MEEEALAAFWDDDKDADIQRLKREPSRVTEERDILKKAIAYFAKDAK
tara:strand:+ start:746 stop:889 length:144 start_codon:yes stop_codon:yes gene_type:complete